MDRLTFDHQQVSGQDFSGRKLDALISDGSRFERCRFEKMRIGDASLGAGMAVTEFIDCSFDGTRMVLTTCGFTRFVRCSFLDAELKDWRGDYVELVDCTFSGKIKKASFWGSLPESIKRMRFDITARWHVRERGPVPDSYRELILRDANEFDGNDFSGADLIDVNFRSGIDLDRQVLPTGPDYLYVPDAAMSIQRVREQVADRANDPAIARMLSFLDILGDEVAQGQRQLLIRPKDFGKVVAPHVSLACELLKSTLE